MTLAYIRKHSNINDRYEWDRFFYLDKEVLSMASLEFNLIHTRFEFKQKDLLLLKELAFLQDKDYNAFGIPLPKRIILEVLSFHKDHNDEFSFLVKQYPFSQLIFSQWQSIKLYERHKEFTQNLKLTYKDFMQKYFTFTYNGRNLNIYEAIAKMKLQEKNNINDEYYSIISTFVALSDDKAITLYDFVYDLIPNSIKREFLKDEASMRAYLPLKEEKFTYTENNFKDKIELHTNIYSIHKPFNEKNIKKEWHTINALNLKDYELNSKELIIPKAKQDRLGIGYDELWELVSVGEEDLEYFKFWTFKDELAPELTEYELDEEGVKSPLGEWNKYVLDEQKMASWEDMFDFLTAYYPYADNYLNLYSGEVWDRGSVFVASSEIQKIAATQYYQARTVILQNNFSTNKALFEEARKQIKKDPDTNFDPTSRYACAVYCKYVAEFNLDIYLAYRFNQALALAFVNAYDDDKIKEDR